MPTILKNSTVLILLILIASCGTRGGGSTVHEDKISADVIVKNAKVTTMDSLHPEATVVAIKDGKFLAVGDDKIISQYQGTATQIIDAGGRRMIPGLTDEHIHLISYGATFNLEIRWDGLKKLSDGLAMIGEQAKRTPEGQWVRVLGGWSPYQFEEKRLPTPEDLEKIAPNTPVMVTHLWDRVILNKAGLKALKIDRNTPAPYGGIIEKDAAGNPTGILLAVSDWGVILGAMGELPAPSDAIAMSSTQQYMRTLNSFGVTSLIDGGAGTYPGNYEAIANLAKEHKMTVRVAGTLYPAIGANESKQFNEWLATVQPDSQDPFYRILGAGEILSYASFDMTNFEEQRPELIHLEDSLRPILSAVIKKGWFFRLHAAYDQTITRMLNVIEEINKETPLTQRWSIDHAETISDTNIERIKKLGGGIGVQDRIYFQGEEFIARYGKTAAMKEVTPVKKMLEKGMHVGFGTDAMRITSYNPWLTPYFFVTGKTITGIQLLPVNDLLTREQALRLFTVGSVWFSGEEKLKGSISAGKFADFSLLSADYFSIPDEEIKNLKAVLTVVDGKVVYGVEEYNKISPKAPDVLPEWSYYNH